MKRIALVHSYLVDVRGGERVFHALCELYPTADIFTLVYDPRSQPDWFAQRNVAASIIQRMPYSIKRFRAYFPLYPMATEHFDLRDYDLVISSSCGWVHGVLTPPECCHISYCHSPLRFAWHWYRETLDDRAKKPVSRLLMALLLSYVRYWDLAASRRVDYFVANSRVTQRRIGKFYRRGSTVVNPPVDVSRFSGLGREPEPFYLIVSSLVGYKRIDVAVRAFSEMGLPLKIVGCGPQYKNLRAMAGPNVEFMGNVGDQAVASLLSRARALIFTPNEDFGIVPLEAQAAGCPVIAYRAGGALETVLGGRTGVFFDHQSEESLMEAVLEFQPERFDPAVLREHARWFSVHNFKVRMAGFVEGRYAEYFSQGGTALAALDDNDPQEDSAPSAVLVG